MPKKTLLGMMALASLAVLIALAYPAIAQPEQQASATPVLAERADCPGQTPCPLTGQLVCVDRCPLSAKAKALTPSCCVKPD